MKSIISWLIRHAESSKALRFLLHDVQYEIEKVGEGGELRNDDELASLVAEVAKSVPSCHKVVERKKIGCSEDFTLLPLEYALEAEKLSSLLSVQTELQPITRENLILMKKAWKPHSISLKAAF